MGASQVALVVRHLPANTEDTGDGGSIPGSGRSSRGGTGNLHQCSCLENPLDGGAWQATVHSSTKSQTRLNWLSMPTRLKRMQFIVHKSVGQLEKDFYQSERKETNQWETIPDNFKKQMSTSEKTNRQYINDKGFTSILVREVQILTRIIFPPPHGGKYLSDNTLSGEC